MKQQTEFVEMAEAMIQWSLSERSIRRRIKAGEIVGKRRGRKWWVEIPAPPKDAADVREANGTAPTASASKTPPPPAKPPTENKKTKYEEYQVDTSDFIDVATGIGKIAVWRKLRALSRINPPEHIKRAVASAKSDLLDGFMAIGSLKIDRYRTARSKICEIVVELGESSSEELPMREHATEALGAIQALIIKLSKQKFKSVER
jgi:hypothetical protein